MSFIDEFEEKTGLRIEDLNSIEKETFFSAISDVQKSQLTLEKLKVYIVSMREAVEHEIVKAKPFIRIFIFKFENPKLVKLQARLQNYILLEAVLMSPQRAKQQLDDMIANVVKK